MVENSEIIVDYVRAGLLYPVVASLAVMEVSAIKGYRYKIQDPY